MKKYVSLIFIFFIALITLASCEVDWTNTDPLHIHTFEDEIIEPTCEERGYTLQTCTKCHHQDKIKYTPALGHDEEVIPAVSKTCTTDGLTEGSRCKRCGKIVKEQEVVPASHNWEYKVGVYPTYYETGQTAGKKCKDCHHEESTQETIEVLKRDYTKNYDYNQFVNNPLYANYKDTFTKWYKELYEGCVEILSNNTTLDENTKIQTGCYEKLDDNITAAFVSSFMNNNPDFYFLSNAYSITTQSVTEKNGVVLKIDPHYYSYANRKTVQDNDMLVEREIVNLAKTLTTEKDKAKMLHDYLANKTKYAYDSSNIPSTDSRAHNIDWIFDDDPNTGCVCEGYAYAYAYLSRIIGLETIIVVGDANGEGHAWNYTKIGSSWYGVDITWDDQDKSNKLLYDFFLASKSEMENGTVLFDASHTPGEKDIINFNPSSMFFQTELPDLSLVRGYII